MDTFKVTELFWDSYIEVGGKYFKPADKIWEFIYQELATRTIAAGALQRRDNSQRNAIMYASENGLTHMVEMLMEAGAEYNLTDTNGKSSLHLAQEGKHQDTITLLLKPGFLKMTREDRGKTLTSVAAFGQIRTVSLLLELDTALDARLVEHMYPPTHEYHKKSALLLALENRQIQTAQLLLEPSISAGAYDVVVNLCICLCASD